VSPRWFVRKDRGEKQDPTPRREQAESLGDSFSIDTRHQIVKDHNVRLMAISDIDRRFAIASFPDRLEPSILKPNPGEVADIGLVIDHEGREGFLATPKQLRLPVSPARAQSQTVKAR
jgi:hypothetical protein